MPYPEPSKVSQAGAGCLIVGVIAFIVVMALGLLGTLAGAVVLLWSGIIWVVSHL